MIKSGKILKSMVFISLALFLTCCKNKKPISFFLDNNDFVNFQLKDNNIKNPFRIESDTILENGAVYFKTSKGTT